MSAACKTLSVRASVAIKAVNVRFAKTLVDVAVIRSVSLRTSKRRHITCRKQIRDYLYTAVGVSV